ncbi:MAG: 16S rRNA (cytosine(1402)-N(4))-methyltransferase RsmH [Myxococcales bacterium]|nr:MAG: 16S rRNA (cytosine(1402)-N(4))-methyltransferase RsmH [Myxococcales bacterium]
MLDEVVDALAVRPSGRYVDGTLGEGGHAERILTASAPGGRLLGLDRDGSALERAGAFLASFGDRLTLKNRSYEDIGALLTAIGWTDGADGILLDLGMSSAQVDDPTRGFSFLVDAPLDMRMDPHAERTAADIVNETPEAELATLLRELGEERAARRIARAIVWRRRQGKIRSTGDLRAAIVAAGVRGRPGHDPATRTFQALRIAVNDELGRLAGFLEDGWRSLRGGGRLVVLSYHSLEDRMVKHAMRRWSADCLCPPSRPVCDCGWTPKVRMVSRRRTPPTDEEVGRNPRARSAGLRAVERLSMEPVSNHAAREGGE